MKEKETEERIFLTTYHHSDLTWQFPYAKYNEIRERQLNIVMDFFERYPEYGFVLDQAYVLQNYIERNPQQKEKIRRYFDKGKGSFELIGEYTIPDLNLCSGESFIRNCILGQQFYREQFGETPETASLMDAFGMPFQVPQILARLGYRYLVPGRMPNAPENLDTDKPFVWKGKGDTALIVVPQGAGIDKTAYITNVPVVQQEDERFTKTLTDLQNTTGNILAYYMTEFQMLDEAFFMHLREVNRHAGDKRRQVTFGRLIDYCQTLHEEDLPEYIGEFNPIFTGCYTTRIGVKQKIRAAENLLFSCELAGALTNENADLSEVWRQLNLAQFHDAACGCHHDSSNIDVEEKLDYVIKRAEHGLEDMLGEGNGDNLSVLNPSSYSEERLIETETELLPKGVVIQQDGSRYYFSASLPACGIQRFETGKDADVQQSESRDTSNYCGQTDYYTFDFSKTMPLIKSKRYNKSVFGTEKFGEIIFRHDSGSMWDEDFREPPCGAEYQDEEVMSVDEGPLFIKVVTQGMAKPYREPISGNIGNYWPGFNAFSFRKEYIFPRHLPYFRMRVMVNFSGCNTKISLRIPVDLEPLKAQALYDTPFAATQRRPYFEVPFKYRATMQELSTSDYAHVRGDYPALHWVDYCDDQIGLAVANNGTPGHQLVGRNIFISLLRSGTGCKDGTMYPQPGAYDNGTHTFDFAFTDHLPVNKEAALWLGSLLNRAPVCIENTSDDMMIADSIVCFDKENIVISAIYHKDNAVIVRAYEIMGEKTECAMSCREKVACRYADFYGNVEECTNTAHIVFEPFEIKTFSLEPCV